MEPLPFPVSPLQLVHYTKHWRKEEQKSEESYLNQEDVFFDAYSSAVILYNQGKFTFLDMLDPLFNLGKKSNSIHLATN